MYQNIFFDRMSEIPTVYVWDDKKGLLSYPAKQFRYAYQIDPKGNMETMTGIKVSKTSRYGKTSTNIFESDLPMETRVLTDLYLDEDEPSIGHKIFYFDIEVSMENGIPDTMQAQNEITSIAFYDDSTSTYVVFVVDKNGVHKDSTIDNVEVVVCDSEEDLLEMFMASYTSISPTIISGWNSDGFDVPYLYNRMVRVMGEDFANQLSPIGIVRYSERQERYLIAGVSSLDYMVMYKKFTYVQRPNYRLDTIGRIEVGMGKVPYDGSLDELYRDDLEKFIEYNLQDVRILVEMNKKLKLFDIVRGVCHIGHVPYEDFSMSSRFLEGTIVTYLHRRGIVVSNKSPDAKAVMKDRGDKQGFTGAYVKDPIPGRYNWVYSLDLESLYPSIIMSINISPETKVGYVLNFNLEKHAKKEIIAYVIKEVGSENTIELPHDKFVKFMEMNELSISSNGVLYTNKKRGVIPQVLENWFALRKQYKNEMVKYANEGNKEMEAYYDQRQHIQKIFLNSLYGVLGLPVFRFYDVDNAKSVTLTGQDVIKSSAKLVDLYYKNQLGPSDKEYVTYIDTDSIYASAEPLFPQSENLNEEEKKLFTINLANELEGRLNKFYDTFSKKGFFCKSHRFRIKGESVARTGFWVAKKLYALDKVYDLEKNQDTKPNKRLVVKGLAAVRSSFPKKFADFMKKLLEDILQWAPKDQIDLDILELKNSLTKQNYVEISRNTTANNLGKYSLVDENGNIHFKKGAPVHVKAALAYNKLLKHFGLENRFDKIREKEKIKYVYLQTNPLRIEALAYKGYEDPQEIIRMIEEYIDLNGLFNKELKNKLQDFYDALSWGKIPTEVNQKSFQFFK